MATKTSKKKATRKRSSSRKRSSKPKGIKRDIGRHPFAPGTSVDVHGEAEVVGRPDTTLPKPLSKAKVTKDGSLTITVKEPGSYVVVGPVGTTDENEEIRRVAVAVNR